MARYHRVLSVGVMLVTASLAVAACTTGSSATKTTTAAATEASIALTADPTTLDPAKGTVAQDLLMDRMLYDTLIRRDDAGTIVSGLAASWKTTATSGTFTLRKGITCSDGKALTATDVATSIQRFADPTVGAGAAVEAFGPGNTVTVTSDTSANTVTVTLAKPWADLLIGLGLPQGGIVCPAALNDPKLLASGGKGAGTGEYYVTKANPGTNYQLTARTGYDWAPGYAKAIAGSVPTTVDMKVISAESTMANQLLTGTLSYAGLTGPDVARFAGNKSFTIVPAPIVSMMVAFNERPGHPGADPAFRKAVAEALDQKAFNQAVTRGSGTLLTSIAGPEAPCVSTDASLLTAPNAAAAKASVTGKKIIVEGTNAVAAGAGNEYVQAALTKAGAKVTLKNVDNATWGTDVLGGAGDWDVTVWPNLNLTNLLTAPASLLTGSAPPAGENFTGMNNTAFNAAYATAMATSDQTASCQAWGQAQQALLASNDIVPLAAVNVYYITSNKVTALAPDGLFDPSTMRVVK